METSEDGSVIKLIRRNGSVVPWATAKVRNAVSKAFIQLNVDCEPAHVIAETVESRITADEHPLIHVEDVQDYVQEELMRLGYFKVAEAYILYRNQRKSDREKARQRLKPPPEVYPITVIRNGEETQWEGEDLSERIEYASLGVDLCYSHDEIESRLLASVYDGIEEENLKKTILLNAKSLIEKDSDFSKFTGRMILSFIYEEVLGWDIVKDGVSNLKAFHREKFLTSLKKSVELNRLNPDLLKAYNIEKLARAIDPHADMEFDCQGIQVLYDRYLLVNKTEEHKHVRLEVPQYFWMRVAMGLFIQEPDEDKVIKLYKMYKDRRFCSSTPTLFNSGTQRSQLSSCYLYYVPDSIEGIMQKGISENAYLSKWAGGLGGSWTSVRGTGSHICGTNGESQGVIPFLKMHNDLLLAVNQGGKRKGAGCAYLESWHSDFLEFLELRKNTGDERRRTHDMNTAVWLSDLFMTRVEARADWTFFRSNEVSDLHESYGKEFKKKYEQYEKKAADGEIYGQTVPALEVWKKMLSMLFETGHPWITFKDPCNIRSPQSHAGVIHSSNLCTEITLNTSEKETAVCNLGSIIIDNHLTKTGKIDARKLKATIRTAVEVLDNVIDINFYPTESAKESNLKHRPIGLGVMGLQNAFYINDICFDSEEAVSFNNEMMEMISYYAIEASSDLAKEKGTYSSYKGSKWSKGILPHDTVDLLKKERGMPIEVEVNETLPWDDLRAKVKEQGMRNSNVMAIAPTATIAGIMNTTPCIEPIFSNLYVKSNLSGDFVVLNRFLVEDLKKEDLWNNKMLDDLKYFDGDLSSIPGIPDNLRRKYMTAFDIPFESIIDCAAARQNWIDQAQSTNLWLDAPDMPTLSKMYKYAWNKGLKTTYYLRTRQASDVEKATVDRRDSSESPSCRIDDPSCEVCQ
jgi:ribonucleoside-diphosphate reductase alpha chain